MKARKSVMHEHANKLILFINFAIVALSALALFLMTR